MALYRPAGRALADRYFAPVPKFDYVRSPALLRAVRTLGCQHCGKHSRNVEASHSNWAVHGHGRGIKASDIFIAALDHTCHAMLDQGGALSGDERKVMWWQAHCKTIRLLRELRRWPGGVPVPDLEHCPWVDLLPKVPA